MNEALDRFIDETLYRSVDFSAMAAGQRDQDSVSQALYRFVDITVYRSHDKALEGHVAVALQRYMDRGVLP